MPLLNQICYTQFREYIYRIVDRDITLTFLQFSYLTVNIEVFAIAFVNAVDIAELKKKEIWIILTK